MPLRFLVPAFLLGLAALAIPLLVHLTRRQKAQVVEFPSLMFLERVPFQAESRRRIHHWLLMLLRALAVALVVAAFARPLFSDESPMAAVTGGPREVVVLLDRSYSMGVEDRWDRALVAARETFRSLGPLDRASLATFARNAAVLVRSSSDPSRLLSALDTLTLSHQATSYGPGLKLAQAILEETELPATELVVIGDFQASGWTGDEGVRLPPGTVVTPIQLGDSAVANRAVAAVQLDRSRLEGRDRITAAARVTRVGGTGWDTLEVVLELEGIEVQREPVVLPPDGASGVVFDPFNVSRDFTRGSIRLSEADLIGPDDQHFFVLSPGRTLDVLILDDPRGGGAQSLFLREALAISQENVFGVTSRSQGAVGSQELAGTAVLVVNDRSIPGGNTAELLRGFVEEGGGILVVMGERFRWPSELSSLLPGSFTQPQDRRDGRGGRLGQLAYDHPVFEIFRGPRSGDFTGARFYRARDLQVAETEEVQVLARYDDGSVALAERRVGEGRVLAWTSTLDAYWNDLARQPVYLPFVHQLIRYTSGKTETVPSFIAGHVLDVTDSRAMATAGLGEVLENLADGTRDRVAITPSGATVSLPAGEGPHFLHLNDQGIYEIRVPGAQEGESVSVAVNVDLGEADLTPLDPEEMSASMATAVPEEDPSLSEGGQGEGARLRMEDQERRQSLWRYLLLAAVLLLGLETLISNRLSRASGGRGMYAGA